MSALPSPCWAYLSLSFLLLSCGEKTVSELSLRTERQLAATLSALQRQADEFERQSRGLERQLADLEESVQAKETADLKERIATIRAENDRLLQAAAEARQRSNELSSALDRTHASKPLVSMLMPIPSASNEAPSLASFRRDLAAQGTWLDVLEYGSVWQPAVSSNLSWRPYVDGSWAWSAQGWTWSSNETFGRICYRYGRWTQLPRQGWVWVPGTEWAPAWVSWRTGQDCIGWAPLPPGPKRRTTTINSSCDEELRIPPSTYCFVSTRHFIRSSYSSCLMTPLQVSQVFRQTTNITQIVLIGSSHHPIHIHRRGPDRQSIEEVCRLPIRELAPPRPTLVGNASQRPTRPLNNAPNPAFGTLRSLPTPPVLTEVIDSPAPNRRLPEASSQHVVITAARTEPPREQPTAPDSAPSEPRTQLTHPLEIPTRNLLATADTESTRPLPVQRAGTEAQPIDARPDRLLPLSPDPRASPRWDPSLHPSDPAQQQQSTPRSVASGVNLQDTLPIEDETNLQSQNAAQKALQDLQRQEAALRTEQERQQQLAMQAERQAQEAALRAEQERQQQLAMEAERQAQEAALRAEQERQQQLAMEAERQAQEAALRAEQERQQQLAMEAERQAQEAALRAEQERQQQLAMEAERQAQEAALRAEQERQQQLAAMEAERLRQNENRPSQE